ncbi:MAG: TIGR00366 family protein [Maribacter sp.]|nr:TIGR00366 family protein [Maribacter sp.]
MNFFKWNWGNYSLQRQLWIPILFLPISTGGFVNFAIPFAEGEFAVVGPRIINAVKEIGAGLTASEMTTLISKASLSIAQGESFSNM